MLSPEEALYYDRHLRLPGFGREHQETLKKSTVLIIGAGGLGCPILQFLAAAGVGKIVVIDPDVVDISNLHRQVIYRIEDVGFPKAIMAERRLKQLNPHVEIKGVPESFGRNNAIEWVSQVDIVVDCSDNFATRYLANDACVIKQKPLIYGAIDQFSGQVSVFNYNGGPTYRCLFPEQPPASEAPSCSEIGVIGVLPGIVGSYQALECIKVLTSSEDTLSGTLLMIDTLKQTHVKIQLEAVPENQSITELGTYDSTRCEPEIDSIDFEYFQSMEDAFLLDVREPYEFEQRNLGGHHIPLNDLPDRHNELPKDRPIAALCAKGIRSWHACVFLKAHGYEVFNLEGGLSVIP